MRKLLEPIGKALRASPAALEAFRGFGGSYFAFPRSAYVDGAYIEATTASYAHIYATQENVRIVVNKIATVAAAHSLRCYALDTNNDREEASDHPAMRTLREPNDYQAQKELLETMIRDKLIYDDAYLWDLGTDIDSRRFLIRVPPPSMAVKTSNRLMPSGYRVLFQDGTWLDLSPDEVIHWRGYSAGDNRLGVPPLETLRVILAESAARKAQSIEQVKGGLVKGGIVERPADAPAWSPKALERFSEHFSARLRGIAKGQVGVLDEGMKFQDIGITPKQAEMLETRKFDLATVANVYGVNPGLFLESGNLKEARDELEEDVVMPMLGKLDETLTHQLMRRIYNDRKHFFRFRPRPQTDISKLFEAGSKATGGSTLTPNEFRKDYLDKPPVAGGDSIVSHPGSQGGGVPPAPDSNPRGRPPVDDIEEQEKALRSTIDRLKVEKLTTAARKATIDRRDGYAAEHAELLRNHFRRQLRDNSGTAVDAKRWNDELGKDLALLGLKTVRAEGDATAARLAGEFDSDQVVNYVKAGAEAMARNVNAVTAEKIRNSTEGKAEEDIDPRKQVLEDAIESRSDSLGMNRATGLAAFAAMEAAKQNPPARGERQKEWIWSRLANSRHESLSGQQVGLYKAFPNGMQYPGDPKGGAEQNANCECVLFVG